jgi:hypothetical protein
LIATHKVAFFLTSETHVVIVHLCLLLPTPLALSPQKVTPVPTTLALPLLIRSLTRFVCSYVSVVLSRSPPPAVHALRITLNFSPQKASVAAGRPAVCATAKGASRRRLRRPLRCRRGRETASYPPPRGHTRLIESHRQGGN